MKIKENIYLLELPNIIPGRKDSIYPTLIKKGQELTLIDTGFPNQVDDIKSAIEKENLDFYKLKKHNTYSSRYRPYGKCKSYFKITATDRANCL